MNDFLTIVLASIAVIIAGRLGVSLIMTYIIEKRTKEDERAKKSKR